MEGLVAVWGLTHNPDPDIGHSLSISEGAAGPGHQLLGSYRHSEWVRSLAEVDGTIFSCCKDGEVRCVSAPASPSQSAPGASGAHRLGRAGETSHPASQASASAAASSACGMLAAGVGGRQRQRRPQAEASSMMEARASWRLSPGDASSSEGGFAPAGGDAASAFSAGPTQVFGLAADGSGIVAGCQDRTIRQWWFSEGGVLTYA